MMKSFVMLVILAVILALISLEGSESKSHRSDIPIEIYQDYFELKVNDGLISEVTTKDVTEEPKESHRSDIPIEVHDYLQHDNEIQDSSQENNRSTEATTVNSTRQEPKEKLCQCVCQNTNATTTTTAPKTTEKELKIPEKVTTEKIEKTTEDFKPSTTKLPIRTTTRKRPTFPYRQSRPWYSECEKIYLKDSIFCKEEIPIERECHDEGSIDFNPRKPHQYTQCEGGLYEDYICPQNADFGLLCYNENLQYCVPC